MASSESLHRDGQNTQEINGSLPSEGSRLRARLAQARLDAERLLIDAGIKEIETEAALRLQRLLLAEMHHRMKNMLANVKSIVSQSLKNAVSVDEGRRAVERRLDGLNRAQDLLMQTNWSASKLTDVIRRAVEPFDDLNTPRFEIDDDALQVGAHAVMPLSLSLNELCTNAVKAAARLPALRRWMGMGRGPSPCCCTR